MAANDRPADIQWLIDNQTDRISGYMVRGVEAPPPAFLSTDASGNTVLVGADGVIKIEPDDRPILVIGGDHPYDQWGSNGLAALYQSYGVNPYIAINTQGTDTIIPGDATALTWSELAALKSSGVEILAHGARHIYDHRLMNTGIRIQYSGANASASVNIDATTLTLTDAAPTAITITGKTLTEVKAEIDAVADWTCTIAEELTGSESAENLLLLNAARTIKTGGVVTAANTYFACGGGIVIRYGGGAYAHVHALIASSVLRIYGDGALIVNYNLTDAAYDTLAELVAAMGTITGLNAYVCNNNLSAVPGATNYVLGDEKSTNLKAFAYANLTETWFNVDAGLPQWYMEDRQLQKCLDDAAANGLTLTDYAQSGSGFYSQHVAGHGQFRSFRGNPETRYIKPLQEPCARSPANFFLHQNAGATNWTSAYLNAVVDALVDSGPWRVNTLIHAVAADGTSGFPGIITHGSEDIEITEAELVAHLAHVKTKVDAAALDVLTQRQAVRESRRKSKPANMLFNPKFRNSGAEMLNVAESLVNRAGEILPGWQLVTPNTVFSAASVADGEFTATTTAATPTDFLTADLILEPGKTYEIGVLADVSAYTSGSGFKLGVQYNRGRIPLIATPEIDRRVSSGYVNGTAGNAHRMQHMKYMFTVPPVKGYSPAKVVSVAGPYNLVSTPADIKLNIASKGLLNINVAGATPAATTTDEVVAAINAAITASAAYPAEYRTCARNIGGKVVIEAPYVGLDTTAPFGISLEPGTATSATALIFGTAYTQAQSSFSPPNEGPNFVATLVIQCAIVGTWSIKAPFVHERYRA